MNTPKRLPFTPPMLAGQTPEAANRWWSRTRARILGRPAALLLCLGCLLVPFGASVQAQPVVTLVDVPANVLIGQDFTFKIKFRNATAVSGYGPFIDLVLERGGADVGTASGPCDGVKFVSAKLLTGGPLPLTTLQRLDACPATLSAACVPLFSHPFDATGSTAPLSVIGAKPGSELQTIILPFGHYESTQPELEIEVTAHVSNFADANVPLSLSVRGGFRYGASPTGTTPIVSDGPNLDSCSWAARATVNPTVMTLRKTYLGPEGEAASGPNFVNYYPLTYQLTTDIADGQTITGLVLQDLLPPTLVYQNNVTVTINGVPAVVNTGYLLSGPTAPPNSVLTISLVNAITGTAATNDVVVTFQFFIPSFDQNGDTILSANCAAGITNVFRASGNWTPTDPRDLNPPPPPITATVTNIITAKCLAVQKTVRHVQSGDYPAAGGYPAASSGDLNYPGPTPGDLLRYEITFQISDYKTIGNLVLTDWLSDGQKLEQSTAPLPQLTVRDQFGMVQATFNSANFGGFNPPVAPPGKAWWIDTNSVSPCTPPGFPPALRADRYTFNISQLMMDQTLVHPRHVVGLLTGGVASFPFSATPGPAIGTLVFYVRIQDRLSYLLSYLPLSGFIFVDKHDPLVNCVEIRGDLFPNANAPAVPVLPPTTAPITTSDDSSTGIRIVGAPFTKTVYAVNGSTTGFANPPNLTPGDTVTFRLTKTLPSGDAEGVVLRDFPPLPVLKVMDPNANGSSSYPWLAPSGSASPTPPAAGLTSFGPSHTLPNGSFPTTVMSSGPNELAFSYAGQTFNLANTPYVIDILFTMKVGSDPIADGLFLTNEAVESEKNSFNETFAQVALAQIKMAEPNLRITKGVVATSDPGAVFTRPGLGGLVFTPPDNANCIRFSGSVNSTTLPWMPQLTSDVCHLQTNARVTFAIVVENLGSGPLGAFDVKLRDLLPACFSNAQNVCVADGNGTSLFSTGLLLGTGMTLTDNAATGGNPALGALAAYHPTSGKNLAIITFDATYVGGCCANRAELLAYSNTEGGANFVTAGLVAQVADEAGICCAELVVVCPPDKTVACGSAWTFGVPVAASPCLGTSPTITVLRTATNGTFCSQIITRTWQVTDACLNTNFCTQTVTVVDTTPPVLTCATNKTIQCGTAWKFDAPTASDACSGTNVTVTILNTVTNGSCPMVFMRIWLATDLCGNNNTCTQTVTVVDTTPPIFIAAPGTGTGIVGTYAGRPNWQAAAIGTTTTVGFATLDSGSPITSGNTDTFFASLMLSGAEFVNVRSYFNAFVYVGPNAPLHVNLPPGTYSFGTDLYPFNGFPGVYTITLSSGQIFTVNSGSGAPGPDFFGVVSATPILWVEFSYNNSPLVLDNFSFATQPLVSTCPTDKTVPCGTNWIFDAPSAFDACSGTNVTVTILSTLTNGFCPQVITRTWLATDLCGNTNTCDQTVTIVDTTPPVFGSAAGQSYGPPVALPGFGNEPVQGYGINNSGQVVGTSFGGGGNNGLIWTPTSTTSGVYVNAPMTLPKGTAPFVYAFAINSLGQVVGADNGFPNAAILWTPSSGVYGAPTPLPAGVATAINASGVIVGVASGGGGPVYWIPVAGVYNLPTPLPTGGLASLQPEGLNDAGLIVGSAGTQAVLWTPVAGVYGPPALLPAGIYSVAVMAKGINAAGQIVGVGNAGLGQRPILWTPVSGVYGAPVELPILNTAPWQATGINAAGQIVGFDAGAGNSVIWSPLLGSTCPTNKMVPCGTNWIFDAPTAYDACSGTNVTVTILSTVTNAPCVITRTWLATDLCGNTNTCSQTVTIVDTTPPVFTSIPAAMGTFTARPAWQAAAAGTTGPIEFDQLDTGNPITSGNTDTFFPSLLLSGAEFVNVRSYYNTFVYVAANAPLHVNLPPGTYSFGADLSPFYSFSGDYTITLSSGQVFTLNSAAAPFGQDFFGVVSPTPIAWVEFSYNNSALVLDDFSFGTTPLASLCATNKTVQCGTAWTFDAPTAYDACSGTNVTVTILSTVTNGFCPQVITRTWLVRDLCGNTNINTCSQTVTVVDTTPPVLTCATNKTVQCGTAWTFDAPTASDACSTNVTISILSTVTNGICPKVLMRIWVATDACGNANTCTQTVTLVDTIAPVIIGCQNIIANALHGTTGNYVTYSATAVDGCFGPVPVTFVPPSGSFFPVGTTPVIGTAVDPCGNTNTCEFTVTVRPSADACLQITREVITCLTNGGYSYTFSVTNLSAAPVTGFLFAGLPTGVTITPYEIVLPAALATGQGTTVAVIISSTGCAPTNLCFRLTTYDERFEVCCFFQHCIALPGCCTPRTYTLNADFAEGTLLNVNFTNVSNQLQINSQITPFPYVWIASGLGTNFNDRGSVMKIDAVTGVVLGEYRTAPFGNGLNPSRTTVDRHGNCWIANRGESSGGQGSVVRVALLIGGTRVDAAGNPSATGQYLKPPFAYNSGAMDRDGDGLIKTSRGLNDRLPWAAGRSVATAEDEAITMFLRVPGTGARSLAVDRDNNLWVGGGYSSTARPHQKFDSVTGLPLSSIFDIGSGGYGAAIDRNGILWSAGRNVGLFRMDTLPLSPIAQDKGTSGGDYGLSIDPCTDNLWHAAIVGSTFPQPNGATGSVFVRGGPLGAVIAGPFGHGHAYAQGVCVDQQGNVFVAHSVVQGGATTVGRLTTSGCYVGNIPLTFNNVVVGRGPTGVAVGHDGKIWVSCYYSHNVLRIDPNSPVNGFGTGCSAGIPRGAVDLVVDLNANGGPTAWPYNYSDETGFHMLGSASPGGFWNVIRDGCVNGQDWGTVSWNSLEPAGTSIKVEVRAADTQLGLTSQPFTAVTKGVSFCNSGIAGRYLEIHVSFYGAGGCNAPSPILYDLTVDCSCVPTNRRPTIVCPGPFFFPINNANVAFSTLISVNDADGNPLTVTWSVDGGVGFQTDYVPAGAPAATVATLGFTYSFAPGQHIIQILVNDGAGGVAHCEVIVQIGDTKKGPIITVPKGISVAAFTGMIPDFIPGLMAVDDRTPTAQIVLNQKPLPGLAVGQGAHIVELTARDLAGNTATSQTFYAVNPVVGITSPANYATFTSPATVSVFTTLASNVTGVASVRLLNGGAVVGTITTAPYNFVLSNLTAGNYILTAQAVSTDNLLSTSDGVIISVVSPGQLGLGPTLADVMVNNRNLTFSLLTEPGVTCYVEYTSSLSPRNWILLRTIVGDGSAVTVTDSTTNGPRRFYRVVSP